MSAREEALRLLDELCQDSIEIPLARIVALDDATVNQYDVTSKFRKLHDLIVANIPDTSGSWKVAPKSEIMEAQIQEAHEKIDHLAECVSQALQFCTVQAREVFQEEWSK